MTQTLRFTVLDRATRSPVADLPRGSDSAPAAMLEELAGAVDPSRDVVCHVRGVAGSPALQALLLAQRLCRSRGVGIDVVADDPATRALVSRCGLGVAAGRAS